VSRKIYQPHLSTASDARAVRTREALRRALLELLEGKPLDQITIRDIAAAAGIGYTTFFRHHPTKESLLDDIAAKQIDRLISLSLPAAEAGNTREASLALATYVDQHRALWATLLTGGAAGILREQFMKQSRPLAASRTLPGYWIPPEVGVLLVCSGTLELLSWWLSQKRPVSVMTFAELHDRLVVSPIVLGGGMNVAAAAPRQRAAGHSRPHKGE
jgi:AcrR family transcriptional regulator